MIETGSRSQMYLHKKGYLSKGGFLHLTSLDTEPYCMFSSLCVYESAGHIILGIISMISQTRLVQRIPFERHGNS